MVTDARTAQGDVPKANPGTNVNDAIHRFNFAMEFLGAALVALNGSLYAKADQEHQHSIDDIEELSGQLQSLVEGLSNHTHAFSDLVDVNVAGANEGQILQYLAGKIQAVAAKAQFFAHDPISGLTSNNVHSALVQLVGLFQQLGAELEQLRGGTAPETLDTIVEIASAIGDNQGSLADLLEQIGQRARRTEVVPVFGTIYESGTVGSADSGKSYLLADIAAVPVLSIDDVANLPTGWSITVRAMGAPSGFQTAKLHITGGAGVFVFHGRDLGPDFYLIGYGEAFRLTRIASVLLVEKIVDPERRKAVLTHSHNGWANGLTSWTSCPLNTQDGDQQIIQVQNGGGPVAVSGTYSIACRVYNHVQISNGSGYAYAMLEAGGERYSYEWDSVYHPEARTLGPGDTIFLSQGEVVDFRILSSTAAVYYLPANSEVTVALIGRSS